MPDTVALPVRLEHAPVLDAVLGLELVSRSQIGGLDALLPGILMARFGAEIKRIEDGPPPPPPELSAGNQMMYVGSFPKRVFWKSYQVTLAGASVSIAFDGDYPGWATFRQDAIEMFTAILQSGVVEWVARQSVKYVNMFDVDLTRKIGTADILNWAVNVGGHDLTGGNTVLRSEFQRGPFLNILQVLTRADAFTRNGKKSGCIVDIDSIELLSGMKPEKYVESMGKKLDEMRLCNKQIFFESVKEAAVQAMGPTYE